MILAAAVTLRAGDVGRIIPHNPRDEGLSHPRRPGPGAPAATRQNADHCSQENLVVRASEEFEILIAPSRLKHNEAVSADPRGLIRKRATLTNRMTSSLRTKPGRDPYTRRKSTVELAFGQVNLPHHACALKLHALIGN